MHRVGRAGRFGTRGVAVTLLESEAELEQLRGYLQDIAGGEVRHSAGLFFDLPWVWCAGQTSASSKHPRARCLFMLPRGHTLACRCT